LSFSSLFLFVEGGDGDRLKGKARMGCGGVAERDPGGGSAADCGENEKLGRARRHSVIPFRWGSGTRRGPPGGTKGGGAWKNWRL